ncbi:hypothetical protein GCM10011378_30290 [Hymenobacter glacieicola]|uniref:Fibronectin type-III domain-containing protein n=1 Tax=Hymenobacter glacieicola TaxID=1562124 RepID=A0ABQ1WZF7_9BACT|nr:hypothetical protein GCM10011378_30290 [Hymenobacter glacieicola]
MATASTAQAQLILNSAAPVTENFDGQGNAAGAVPTGFVLAAGTTDINYSNAANTTVTTRASGTVAPGALASNSAGAAYNFGNGTTATATDRALGFLSSGSYAAPRHLLLAVRNNTGATITELAVAYDVEKYRTGTNPFEWQFYTSPDGVTWAPQTSLTVVYGPDGANAVVNPPASTSRSIVLSGLSLASGATTYLRWSYVGTMGSGNAQALGLDNLSITPTLSGAVTPTPAATITTGSASAAAFCVTNTAGSTAFNVAYTSNGTYTGSYKVQLSDANGVFATSPTTGIIGSGSSSPISAVIPAGTPSGTGYRVRVLNDAPATFGSDNGTNLSISLTPEASPVTVSPASAQTLPVDGTGAMLTASGAATAAFTWQYGTSATGPYTSIGGATSATYQLKGTDFPGAGSYFVVARATVTTSCGTVTSASEPLAVTVAAPVVPPGLQISQSSLPTFGAVEVGAGSQPKSFTVSGSSLTSSLTITPPAGFEIRTGSSPFACCAIVLEPVGGIVPTTTIDVRFAPTTAEAAQAAIPVTTAGLPAQTVTVSGTGSAASYPATLSTTAVSGLTPTSAITGGSVVTDGGSAIMARGVVWSKTANPVLGTTQTEDGVGAEAFTSTISNLLPGTTYYARAYATNAAGTAYGEEVSFTTVTVPLASEPTVASALSAGQVTTTSVQLTLTGNNATKHLVVARLGSAVDAEPLDAVTYAADAAFGAGKQLGKGNYVVYNGSGTSVTVTNLRPNTPYHFTVFAFNDNDTPYAENYLTTSPGTLTLTTTAVPVALLLEENFEYTPASLLTANGWAAHSGAGSKPVAVTAAGLSYPTYSAGTGKAAALTASGEDVNRSFEPLYGRTPVYASFLVNVANATTSGDYFFHLGPKVIGSTFRSRVFVRKTAGGKLQFGISGSGAATYAPQEYELNTTHLVVVKYSFDEAGSVSQLFLNPTTTFVEPATASATSTETGTTPAAPNDNIGSVALRQGSASPVLAVDAVRVGTSYRTVKTGVACTDPVLSVPSLATVQTSPTECGASVAFAATATGIPAAPVTYTILKDGVITPISSPYFFPVGATTVTASATNSCGTDIKTFVVSVEDKQAPTVRVQNLTLALSEGSATLTADQINNGSSDACGIASVVLNKTVFSCEDIGANTVTLTVIDTHGNTASQTATVTVTGTVPTPAIAVTAASKVYTGGVPTTLFLGYGPQSVTLTASGGESYSWSPAAGLSNVASATPVFTAHAAGTFTYTVTVTSASGCTATKSITLQVVDVRCGNENDGVSVCHNGKILCVSDNAVAAHLAHGDQLGNCSTATLAARSASSAQLADAAAASATPEPAFEAYPNPFTERTVIRFRASSTGPAQLQLYNPLGQLVKTYYNATAQSGQLYEFTVEGTGFTPGLYISKLLLDGKVHTLRLLLTK